MVKRLRESSLSSNDDGKTVLKMNMKRGPDSPRPAKVGAAVMTEPSHFTAAMQCSLPPHRDTLEFTSIEAFEIHYAQVHSNRCASCGKNLPTAHFLALHIDENHNTFREALQAKGEKTYACFVEDCDRKCSTPQKRRLHLIDKHLFPKNYNFRLVDTGIDKSASMLYEGRRRRVSTTTDPTLPDNHRRQGSGAEQNSNAPLCSAIPSNPNIEEQSEFVQKEIGGANINSMKFSTSVSDATINELETSMSALQFVPPSVTLKQRIKPRVKFKE